MFVDRRGAQGATGNRTSENPVKAKFAEHFF